MAIHFGRFSGGLRLFLIVWAISMLSVMLYALYKIVTFDYTPLQVSLSGPFDSSEQVAGTESVDLSSSSLGTSECRRRFGNA